MGRPRKGRAEIDELRGVDVLVVDRCPDACASAKEVGGVDGAGRRAIHGIERVDKTEVLESPDHAGRDHAAHRSALDRERDARTIPMGRAAAPRAAGTKQVNHSFRSASIGLTATARRPGIQEAIAAAPRISTSDTP